MHILPLGLLFLYYFLLTLCYKYSTGMLDPSVSCASVQVDASSFVVLSARHNDCSMLDSVIRVLLHSLLTPL